jgi:CHAD domain-containing protein
VSALHTLAVPSGADLDSAPPVPAGLRVVAGAQHLSRRVWLDTFDRALLAKHVELYLEEDEEAGAGLVVRGAGITTRAGGPAGIDPGGAVSVGSLAPAVAEVVLPLARGRALLSLAAAGVAERQLAVLDDEDKTVCRLTTTRFTAAGAPPGMVIVTVDSLRGYEAAAEEVAGTLAAVPGARVVSGAPVQAWLEALGSAAAPGSLPAGRGLTSDMPAAAAVSLIISRLLATVEANLAGTLARYDTEFLHDLRVAVRRARTAVKLSDGVLHDGLRDRLAEELKWLGDATTPPRDMDVYLESWPDMESQVSEELRPHVEPFLRLIEERTKVAHRELREALGSRRLTRLLETGRELSEANDTRRHTEASFGAFVARSLRDTLERVSKRGRRLRPDSPDEAVHDLRKRAKELRYMLEFSEALLPAERWAELVRDLKALQDALGAFNDSSVQRAFVLDGAEALTDPPVHTLLALGELRGSLARQARQARRQLPDRLAGLERWRSEGLFWDLLAAGKDRLPL